MKMMKRDRKKIKRLKKTQTKDTEGYLQTIEDTGLIGYSFSLVMTGRNWIQGIILFFLFFEISERMKKFSLTSGRSKRYVVKGIDKKKKHSHGQ